MALFSNEKATKLSREPVFELRKRQERALTRQDVAGGRRRLAEDVPKKCRKRVQDVPEACSEPTAQKPTGLPTNRAADRPIKPSNNPPTPRPLIPKAL